MNRIKKNITVRFFSVDAKNSFFTNFVTNFNTNKEGDSNSRIFDLRSKKHLIKINQSHDIKNTVAYSVTVVRERNTWQTKATSDGKITGISLNQGIIGDPYYFFLVPAKQLLLGFTSGPSGSIKSVARTMLDQFSVDRQEKIKLDLIPKEKEFDALSQLPTFSNLHFRINPSSLTDISEDTPKLIKDVSEVPLINPNAQLALDLDLNDSKDTDLTKDDVLEIISYLSDHNGCTVLKVKGVNNDGAPVSLDFGNAYITHKTEITSRNKFIDEKSAIDSLKKALTEYLNL